MEINRYKYNGYIDSLELYEKEISSDILSDLECAKEELDKLRTYYLKTGSYDVSDINENEFELIDYESREEYLIKIDI